MMGMCKFTDFVSAFLSQDHGQQRIASKIKWNTQRNIAGTLR